MKNKTGLTTSNSGSFLPEVPSGLSDSPCAPTCSACRFWKQEGRDKRLGICVDAVERVRKIVPFAINLEASMVFAHGGKDCPCFEHNAKHTDQP